jgi:hypothetical protein
MNLADILTLLVLLSPILVGGITGFAKSEALAGYADRAAVWFASKDSALVQSQTFWGKYILRWVLWPFKKLGDLTASIGNRYWKSAARLFGYGCYTLSLLFVAAVLTYLAIMIAVTIFVAAVIFKVLASGSGSDSPETTTGRPSASYRTDGHDIDRDDEAMASAGVRGQKIYSGTNWFNEELKGRVDEEGNLYKGTNWFTEEKIGRIDDEGNIYSGTSWASEVKVGRIDKDGTLYKGSNWFTEDKTGRIAEDGTIHKGTNWFNEEKRGRTGD